MSSVKPRESVSFEEDLIFLREYIQPIILKDGDRQVIVSSEYQGRVFTSTSRGLKGDSYGWFNKKSIAQDPDRNQISKAGGGGRIWFGPDQGPNSVFVGIHPDTQELTKMSPKDLDTLSFEVTKTTSKSVTLKQSLKLINALRFNFYINVNRKIELINLNKITSNLGVEVSNSLNYVAFKAETSMTNIGEENWSAKKGLMSLWELGCMYPSPKTTVVIPLKGNPKEVTVYFTKLDSNRIAIKDHVLYYKADANYFNKIGTLPEFSLPYFGSYSPELNRLTIVRFNFNNATDYVNSHETQIENQLGGDVINVFNDGTWGDIGPFGPFYELETSSPAKALKVGESITHVHETYHFEGEKEALDALALKVLGVDLLTIENALA